MRGDNFSEYYDSAEDITISRERACQELKAHGLVDLKEFFDELGDKEAYSAQDVLDWLGY
tara:strand:- start:485 stop:664 length:180 start_codon:yes stop_codon:yes gene_type:complete